MAPLQHRMVESGRDSERVLAATTRFSAMAMFHSLLSIGLTSTLC